MKVNYVIILVSDMSRSVQFYREALGLPLKFESPDWSEFATEGATFALHATASVDAGEKPRGKETAGHCRPGFSVPSLDDCHKRVISNGVECLQGPTHSFGVRIAQYLDPDGLVISVSENPAD